MATDLERRWTRRGAGSNVACMMSAPAAVASGKQPRIASSVAAMGKVESLSGDGVEVLFDGDTLWMWGTTAEGAERLNGGEGGKTVGLTLDVLNGIDHIQTPSGGELRLSAAGAGWYQLPYRKRQAKGFARLHSDLTRSLNLRGQRDPRAGYFYELVGISYYRAALARVIKAQDAAASDVGWLLTMATLQRQPRNKYDSNAVKATIHGRIIGYVAASDAPDMGERIGDGMTVGALVTWTPTNGPEATDVFLALPERLCLEPRPGYEGEALYWAEYDARRQAELEAEEAEAAREAAAKAERKAKAAKPRKPKAKSLAKPEHPPVVGQQADSLEGPPTTAPVYLPPPGSWPAGWYAAPEGGHFLRWWNGSQWTVDTHPWQ